MSERVHHCPFLNQSDERCSSHFSLDRLGDAFDHCLNQYAMCPVYRDLLLEVRNRRAETYCLESGFPGQKLAERDGMPEYRSTPSRVPLKPLPARPHGSPIIQLTLAGTGTVRRAHAPASHHDPERAAGAARVSGISRV